MMVKQTIFGRRVSSGLHSKGGAASTEKRVFVLPGIGGKMIGTALFASYMIAAVLTSCAALSYAEWPSVFTNAAFISFYCKRAFLKSGIGIGHFVRMMIQWAFMTLYMTGRSTGVSTAGFAATSKTGLDGRASREKWMKNRPRDDLNIARDGPVGLRFKGDFAIGWLYDFIGRIHWRVRHVEHVRTCSMNHSTWTLSSIRLCYMRNNQRRKCVLRRVYLDTS
ncbi:hypothetical protein [Collibacillus ludicampi]|uniref:hypothetical protein n=1 Tax=Collibacillus ludicampi TaxID=2771369 RepID=UPI0024946E0D|nr:hypothetical protein [Collibacillus ludicampi]